VPALDLALGLGMEDADQTIRREQQVTLENLVGYRERANHRSPSSIPRFIQRVLPFEFVAANDLPGMWVTVKTYDSEAEQLKAVGLMVGDLLKQRFHAEDITILTLKGANTSVLHGKSRITNTKSLRA